MTRSSWHCFWMLMTFVSPVLCVLCLFLAGPSVRLPVGSGQGLLGVLTTLDEVRVANELLILTGHFCALMTIVSGTAWWACAMALAERKPAIRAYQERVDKQMERLYPEEIDVDFRN